MAIFGADLSHYQPDSCVRLLTEQGYHFVIIKATEGMSPKYGAMLAAGYTGLAPTGIPRTLRDATFASKLGICREIRFPCAAYHYVTSTSTPAQQVTNIAGLVPRDVPLMLDIEAGATLTQGEAIGDALNAAGWMARIVYGPRPHPRYAWCRASYGTDPAGYASVIYPGDDAAGWVGQDIWQFGQHGKLDGYPGYIDVDAVRMTLADLYATGWFLTHGVTPTPARRPDMALFVTKEDGRCWAVDATSTTYIADGALVTAFSKSTGATLTQITTAQLADFRDRQVANQLAVRPDVDVAALAAALAAQLPPEATEAVVEEALRRVLGSLDQTT